MEKTKIFEVLWPKRQFLLAVTGAKKTSPKSTDRKAPLSHLGSLRRTIANGGVNKSYVARVT